MQHLEVSCAVRPLKWPLCVKWLSYPGLYGTPKFRYSIHKIPSFCPRSEQDKSNPHSNMLFPQYII